ncbi:immunity 49 family protein [Streptomyces sp. NRRL F-4489]|uniref:immunity 49 family protein n=1 Tax=Streptomyces sp. NRRL F-4489 TaxID=1609095 RepID=UPI001F4885A9|nr:immunity 49 family protein [Streptomyces sp. NRRL F-4489]
MALHARCVIDPRAAKVETWEATVNAMQLGSALFAVTSASEGTIQCRIDRKARALQAIGPLSSADAGNWLTAFWLAVICRLQGVLYPPINLFYHFVLKDEAGFSPALEEALKLHQMYWTMTEERRADVDGSIALGPLAIACLAYDGKLPIEVESEYLPKHLLQHSWLRVVPQSLVTRC